MYYTIEGKRVLGILYIAGLITGTLFFNITIKMQVFKVSDFLDFTEYMKMLENIDLAIFCSYVVFVRFRQLLLFFVGLFLFSPYIVYGMIFVIVYIYLFRNAAIGNFYTVISRGWRGTHTLLKDRIIIILLIIGLFFVGCYIEAYISPSILKKIFGIFT